MNFLDEVKKAQAEAINKPLEKEKQIMLRINEVVNLFADKIREEILSEIKRNSSPEINVTLYIKVPENLFGVGHIDLYKVKRSLHTIMNDYFPTEYLTYFHNQLSLNLQPDHIIVSECLVGTQTSSSSNSKKIISYSYNEDYHSPNIGSMSIYNINIYHQFDAMLPFNYKKQESFLVTKYFITQNGIKQEIYSGQHPEIFIQIQFHYTGNITPKVV